MAQPPVYFFHQGLDGRCVLYALQNVVGNLYALRPQFFPTCSCFEEITRKMVASHVWPVQELIAKKLFHVNSHDAEAHCACTQEAWSMQVALRWLDSKNISYRAVEEDSVPQFTAGHFLVFVKLKKHKNSKHAVGIINGWLLDSLSTAPRRLEPGDFNDTYLFIKAWEILR